MDLMDAKINSTNEWLAFRAESKAKVDQNEKRIAELKIKIDKPGSTFDKMYRVRIEKLESQNAALSAQLDNFKGNETEWQTFKTNFNRDIEEIGKNIADLFK
jgi:uncharacterized protein YceH (UPF0502 family)